MQEIHHETIYRTEATHWWYRVRRQMVHDIISKYFKEKHSLKILDTGCGTGGLLHELTQYSDVQGIDFSEKAVNFCKERGFNNVTVGDITNISYTENSFDIVLALDVIEHISNDNKALSEIHRVLKPGGKAIIFVPTFMFLWGITDELSQHFRRYTLPELKMKATAQGLITVRGSYFNSLLFIPIAVLRILVRMFRIKIRSENELGSKFTDKLLYSIFNIESKILRYINFPFGVSAMLICTKESNGVK